MSVNPDGEAFFVFVVFFVAEPTPGAPTTPPPAFAAFSRPRDCNPFGRVASEPILLLLILLLLLLLLLALLLLLLPELELAPDSLVRPPAALSVAEAVYVNCSPFAADCCPERWSGVYDGREGGRND